MLSSVLFLLHSMLFFYNRYELPAVLNGQGPERIATAAHRSDLPPSIDALTPDSERRSGPALLPRPLNRERNHPSITSLASSSLGRGSVAGGLNILFNGGGSHDEDGDFFMSGEVVGRRDRNAARRPGPPSTISATSTRTSSRISGEQHESTPERERRVSTQTLDTSITQQSDSPASGQINTDDPSISAELFPLSMWDRHVAPPTQSPESPDDRS